MVERDFSVIEAVGSVTPQERADTGIMGYSWRVGHWIPVICSVASLQFEPESDVVPGMTVDRFPK